MSLKNAKKVETNRYQLEIEIGAEPFAEAVNNAIRTQSKKITLPGFRKGKAPLHMIEKYYGAEAFYEEALNALYVPALEEAAKEAGVEIVDDQMDFEMVSISKETGAHFKVTLTVVPEVKIGQYKGLKAQRVAVKVEKAEVDEAVNAMAERNARMVAVEDRAAEKDDIAVIDYEGFADGKAFEGGKGESYSLTLGSGQFIPGFEEQVIGHRAGESFDVVVTFPAEYHAQELAGKEATFKVTVHEIKKRELPSIDDEFAKDVSEFDTLKDLRADLKKKALERKQKTADDEVETALLTQVMESLEGDIPEAMYENRVKQDVKDFDYRLQMQGMNLETYMKYTGSTMEEFSKTFRPQAEKQVKMRLALEAIVKLENLTADDGEVDAYYEKMAADYSVSADQVKQAVPAEEVKKDLAVQKALDLIKSTAVITETEAKEEAKAPAKKPAAKKTAAASKEEVKPAAKKAPSKAAEKKPAAKTAEKKPAAEKKSAAKKPAAKKADKE